MRVWRGFFPLAGPLGRLDSVHSLGQRNGAAGKSYRINCATTLLVDGSCNTIANRERRAALERAAELLRQLSATVKPLAAESGALCARVRGCLRPAGSE
jgi:hypothetical protein